MHIYRIEEKGQRHRGGASIVAQCVCIAPASFLAPALCELGANMSSTAVATWMPTAVATWMPGCLPAATTVASLAYMLACSHLAAIQGACSHDCGKPGIHARMQPPAAIQGVELVVMPKAFHVCCPVWPCSSIPKTLMARPKFQMLQDNGQGDEEQCLPVLADNVRLHSAIMCSLRIGLEGRADVTIGWHSSM